MWFPCKSVDASFLDGAALRFVETVDIARPAAEVFAILEDAASWPRWFKGMRHVEWTSVPPFGEGTTRTVTLDAVKVQEHFFRWEPGRRFSFFVTGHNRPLWHALAEDYLLEDLSMGECRFTYVMALEPRFILRAVPPITARQFGGMVKTACTGLREYARNARAPSGDQVSSR